MIPAVSVRSCQDYGAHSPCLIGVGCVRVDLSIRSETDSNTIVVDAALAIYDACWASFFSDTIPMWSSVQPLYVTGNEVFSHYDGVALERKFGGATSAALLNHSCGSIDSWDVFLTGNYVHVGRP